MEDKHIERDKNDTVTLDQLFDWFLKLQEVKALDSYVRMTQQIKSLSRLINTNQVVRDLTALQLEEYARSRLQEPSPTKRGQTIAPKTVKEELNLLRNVFNRALQYEFVSKVPVSRYPTVKIDNVRKRVFSEVEYQQLLEVCPLWLRRIVIMARGTGMRQGEILKLRWSDVDL